jgi:hypothetical protein
VSERARTPEEIAARRAELRARYRRRRTTAAVVVVAALIAAGALLAGVVLGGNRSPDAAGPSMSTTTCEPTERPRIVRPRWLTARRQIVLADSVLLGGTAALREHLERWRSRSSAGPRSCCPP